MFGSKDVFMGVKYWLLLPWLPANRCVGHGHLVVNTLSKCWNGKKEPCGPLGIFIVGSGRPTRVVSLQLLVELGIEKLWRKFKTMSPSFAKITQWNHLLPDAHDEWKKTPTTVVGISFLKLLKANYQSSCFRGLLILCELFYSLNDTPAGRSYICEEEFLTFILLTVGMNTAASIWDFSVAVKKGLEHRLWDQSERFGLYFPSSSSWKRYGACG